MHLEIHPASSWKQLTVRQTRKMQRYAIRNELQRVRVVERLTVYRKRNVYSWRHRKKGKTKGNENERERERERERGAETETWSQLET